MFSNTSQLESYLCTSEIQNNVPRCVGHPENEFLFIEHPEGSALGASQIDSRNRVKAHTVGFQRRCVGVSHSPQGGRSYKHGDEEFCETCEIL